MSGRPGEIEGELKKSGSVTLDASGTGVLIFDPDHANQRWEVTSVVVSTNQAATATVIPVATLALNTPVAATMSQGNQRGSTWSGNQDVFRGQIGVGPCDSLSVLFAPPPGALGTPLSGVIASAVVQGTKYTRRS